MRTVPFLIAALSAAGCAASVLRPAGLPSPTAPVENASPSFAGYGEVRVAVKWPSYQTQAIPLSAAALDVALLDAAGTAVATASIVRPTSSATLSRMRVGAYIVRIAARRADVQQTIVADATASLAVVANRIAQASLALVPKFAPRLDSIYPTSGPPGTAIALYGANLGAPPGGTYSVLVDGQPVPNALLQPGSSTVYLTDLPSWAGNAASISVSVDGLAIPDGQVQVFTRQVIDHLTISPTSATLATYQSRTFTATAYQDAAGTVPVPGVTFSWLLTDQNPPPGVMPGSNPFSLSNGVFSATATGSATVRVEAGGKFATASVLVNSVGTPSTPSPGTP